MNDFDMPTVSEAPPSRALLPPPNPGTERRKPGPTGARSLGRRLLGLGLLLLLIGALALGAWRHFEQRREVMATADQEAAFVPSVRAGQGARRDGRLDW